MNGIRGVVAGYGMSVWDTVEEAEASMAAPHTYDGISRATTIPGTIPATTPRMELKKVLAQGVFDTTVALERERAKGRFAHAGGCKKAPDECKQCQHNIRAFADLPALVLARVLGE
jgi:hypothetical protein